MVYEQIPAELPAYVQPHRATNNCKMSHREQSIPQFLKTISANVSLLDFLNSVIDNGIGRLLYRGPVPNLV